jgi:flagellar biosynthesis/type III secretory pathway protein FliH
MATIFKGSEYKKTVDLKTKVALEEPTSIFDVAEPSGVVSKEAFEAQGKARLILEEARGEAAQIKKAAKEILGQVKEEMEKSKKAGFEKGFQEGLNQALQ